MNCLNLQILMALADFKCAADESWLQKKKKKKKKKNQGKALAINLVNALFSNI